MMSNLFLYSNMTSKKLMILKQSVKFSNELFPCIIEDEDEVKHIAFFKHDVIENNQSETISPKFKRTVAL